MLELVFIVRGTANVRKACKPDIISTVFKGKKRAEVTALINIMCGFFFILVKTVDAFIMSSEHESSY